MCYELTPIEHNLLWASPNSMNNRVKMRVFIVKSYVIIDNPKCMNVIYDSDSNKYVI